MRAFDTSALGTRLANRSGRYRAEGTVETGLLNIHLPQDNIFDKKGAERQGLSVGHGFVYLTDPLTPGTYIIEGHVSFPSGDPVDFTTTIIVQ